MKGAREGGRERDIEKERERERRETERLLVQLLLKINNWLVKENFCSVTFASFIRAYWIFKLERFCRRDLFLWTCKLDFLSHLTYY